MKEQLDQPLKGRRVLVVEDEYLVAEALSAVLEQAGASVLGPIGWAEEALSFVQSDGDSIDSAVVDVNLHGETSYQTVDALATRNVPFVLVTGYEHDAIADGYRGYPRCQKPFNVNALLKALAKGAGREH
ncbi:response regulator [Paraburkholderia kururiensis]|uniref:Response regulator n=1 Tax=Paraburkholderia kururiensis TaxID=984307 RepID=A0ABZ0WI05_9BURK|nr:response regulator [Paraburkholderia kururiensis]WQD76922.1 response regulator [Paraburkholderia kururiensis]